MKNLSANWITEHLVDFEYKKYMLLAYLEDVKKNFRDKKLYPDLSDIIAHYRNLLTLKNNTNSIRDNFKKNVSGLDIEHLKLKFENLQDEDWLSEIKQIIEYSLPLMASEVNEGKSIFDFVEKHILFEQVGLMPLNKREGYFLLSPFDSKQIVVYNYSLSSFTYQQEEQLGLHTSYFSSYALSLTRPVEKIKQEIICANPSLPNPAVYWFKAKTSIPKEETFLPVAKRMLFSAITTQ
jgi:hypothetical protein